MSITCFKSLQITCFTQPCSCLDLANPASLLTACISHSRALHPLYYTLSKLLILCDLRNGLPFGWRRGPTPGLAPDLPPASLRLPAAGSPEPEARQLRGAQYPVDNGPHHRLTPEQLRYCVSSRSDIARGHNNAGKVTARVPEV